MSEPTQFTMGAEASCTDGVCGKLTRVVVDPVAKAVTHLVIDPKDLMAIGRLVPLELLDDAAPGEIHLRCSMADFEKLQPAEESRFLPGSGTQSGYDETQLLNLAYYPLGAAGASGAGFVDIGPPLPGLGGVRTSPKPVIYDMVPLDEVEVRCGEPVHAKDGDIGLVQGLVIDPASHQVTHVLLQEGHLWGRKQVAIPISAVDWYDDGIQLKITKQEVKDLPEVNVEDPTG